MSAPTSTRITDEARPAIESMLDSLRQMHFERRILERDATLWKSDPHHVKVIGNRLGWLDSPGHFRTRMDELSALADGLIADGITYVALLGMGGSSMAPEVFSRIFGRSASCPRISVLDTTDPRAIQRLADYADPRTTAYICATKSGTTIETLTLQEYFWKRTVDAGIDSPGSHFIAITDPGSKLAKIAAVRGFRAILLNPADIGGRYSALSYFGLAPAAMLSIDLDALLESVAGAMADPTAALELGAFMAGCASVGRDKLTFAFSKSLAPFGAWAEQLIAESLGKEGKGVIPVDNEIIGAPAVYANDRCFVSMRLHSESEHDELLDTLESAGHPVHRIALGSRSDLGGEFFNWEYATAAAGALMQVDPFDEPNVTESKENTAAILAAVEGGGPVPRTESQADGFPAFIDALTPGQYLCIQAYITHDTPTREAINRLRVAIRARKSVATTFGWGPRFLHSTGQMHKGGPGTGAFLQLSEKVRPSVAIPDREWGFETLIDSQAAGDLQAIREKGLPALRVNVGPDAPSDIDALTASIS